MTSHTHNTKLPLSGPPLLHAAHVECLPEVHLDHGCQAVGCHVPHNSELVAKETTQSWEQRQQLIQDKTRRHHIQVHNPKCQQMHVDIPVQVTRLVAFSSIPLNTTNHITTYLLLVFIVFH